jgi:ssDNA-binding Zn-finger/Zn-ribbon topoisomerase 1
MYELMSLRLKCPLCGRSLMDPDQLIDNVPGIHLNIECRGQKGDIWLSSIYGSYNFKSTIDLPRNEIAKFSCPECHDQITSKTECMTCGADMVPFYLDMGGKVSICSRSGCKNHFVEFEDLSIALRKFYQEYGYNGQHTQQPREERIPDPEQIKKDEAREIIETGTFLQTYCPYCRKSLIEGDMLKLKIRNGEEGILILSPYMNVFSSKSTVFLPEDKVVGDLLCPHCDHSLILHDKTCETCGSPVAKISVSARTKLIDFYICTKKGCKWHGLSENDLYEIRLENSMEW